MEPCPLFLRGEIDIESADGLLTTLRSVVGQQSGEVPVDCMDLTFIDLAGLRVLIRVHRELAEQGRHLHLIHPSPFLIRVLNILDFNYLLRQPCVHSHLTEPRQSRSVVSSTSRLRRRTSPRVTGLWAGSAPWSAG
jgi:anti-anti-sigma factor